MISQFAAALYHGSNSMGDVVWDLIAYAIILGIVALILAVPFGILYLIALLIQKGVRHMLQSKRTNSKEAHTKVGDDDSKKQRNVAGIVVLSAFALCMGAIIVYAIIDSTPQAALRRGVDNYDYFLKGREITHSYKSRFHPQDSTTYIETSVEVDKIPELLEANVLESWGSYGYEFTDPVWKKSTPADEYCIKGTYKRSQGDFVEACVNIVTGKFTYLSNDI